MPLTANIRCIAWTVNGIDCSSPVFVHEHRQVWLRQNSPDHIRAHDPEHRETAPAWHKGDRPFKLPPSRCGFLLCRMLFDPLRALTPCHYCAILIMMTWCHYIKAYPLRAETMTRSELLRQRFTERRKAPVEDCKSRRKTR